MERARRDHVGVAAEVLARCHGSPHLAGRGRGPFAVRAAATSSCSRAPRCERAAIPARCGACSARARTWPCAPPSSAAIRRRGDGALRLRPRGRRAGPAHCRSCRGSQRFGTQRAVCTEKPIEDAQARRSFHARTTRAVGAVHLAFPRRASIDVSVVRLLGCSIRARWSREFGERIRREPELERGASAATGAGVPPGSGLPRRRPGEASRHAARLPGASSRERVRRACRRRALRVRGRAASRRAARGALTKLVV